MEMHQMMSGPCTDALTSSLSQGNSGHCGLL